MQSTLLDSIRQAETSIVRGIKLSVPALFADLEFQQYVRTNNVMTWHDKTLPPVEGEFGDVAVFVDPTMTGEGSDPDMPGWEAIIEKLKEVVGTNPFGGNHLVVILTDC
ncbi:hypothetical protein ACRCPS_17715 [Pseudomonas aeruginosa]